jgi:uncharacterized protein
VVAPRFREGRTADGIAAGLDAIDRAIAGTYERPPPAGPDGRSGGLGGRELGALFVVFVPIAIFLWLAIFVHDRRRGWTGGSTGWGGPFIGGGGFGGGSGGGSSGGGFSGGGGSFGGGGSSGSW